MFLYSHSTFVQMLRFVKFISIRMQILIEISPRHVDSLSIKWFAVVFTPSKFLIFWYEAGVTLLKHIRGKRN